MAFHLELLVLLLLVCALNTLIHELGHALTALLVTDARVAVQVGRGRPVGSVCFGRLRITLHAAFFWTGWCGMDDTRGVSVTRRALVLSGGPLASAATAAVSVLAGFTVNTERGAFLALAICSGALIQFLLTALPMRYPVWVFGRPGVVSDGAQIMRALRER